MVQLVFTYKSTIADVNSANGQVGSVVTATNYNPSRSNFTNKMVMMEYAHAHTTKAVDTNIHGVECAPSKLSGSEGKYIRSGNVPSGEDIKTYDHGNFQIAVCGTPTVLADLPIGELWVDYTVQLRKPKLFTALGRGISRDIFANSENGTAKQTAPLGEFTDADNYPIQDNTNSLGLKLLTSDTTNGTLFELPDNFAGYLEVKIQCNVQSDITLGAYDWHRIQVPERIGNIEYAEDMYWAGTYSENSQPKNKAVWNPAVMAPFTNDIIAVSATFHFKVEPASGGVKNQLKWGVSNTNAFNGQEGDILIWRKYETAVTAWDGTGSGTALANGDARTTKIEFVEYKSPLEESNSVSMSAVSAP